MPQRRPEVATVKRGPARVNSDKGTDMTQKVATEPKMKSRQATTSLGQIMTFTAKPRICDKERWLANLSPVWMSRRSNFRQFSLRFKDCLSSVSFSGPSWALVALARSVVFIYATPQNSRGTWELGCLSDSLILRSLYISPNHYFHIDHDAPCFPPRNFA